MNAGKVYESFKAFDFYKIGRLSEMIYPIEKLSSTFCSKYTSPSIINNKFLAQYYSSEDITIEDQLAEFTSYLHQELPLELQNKVNSHLIPTDSGYLPGILAGGGYLADRMPPEVSKEELFNDSSRDFHIIKYNTAVLAFKTQNYQLALFYLKDIFKEAAFMDEYMLLKTSLFLIEVLLCLRRPAHADVVYRFLIDHKAQILRSSDERVTMDVSLEIQSETPQPSPLSGSHDEEESKSEPSRIRVDDLNNAIRKDGRHTYMLTLGAFIPMHGICPNFTPKIQLLLLLDLLNVRIQIALGPYPGSKKNLDIPAGLKNEDCINKVEEVHPSPAQIDDPSKKYPPVGYGDQDLVPILKAHLRAARALTLAEYDLKIKGNAAESMRRLREEATTKGGAYGWPPTASRPEHQIPQSNFLFPAYYFNNMGIIHMRMKRIKLAILYFQRALDCVGQKEEGSRHITTNPLSHFSDEGSEKVVEISYNLAFAHQMNGQYPQAYQIYKVLLPYLGQRARIWYRMGECCYHYHHQKLIDECSKTDPLAAGHAGFNAEPPPYHSKKGCFIPSENFSRIYLRLSPISPPEHQMDLAKAKHYLQSALIMLRNQIEQHAHELVFLKEVRNRYNPEKLEEQRIKPIRIIPKQLKTLPPEVHKMYIRIHLFLAHIALIRGDHVQCLNTLSSIDQDPNLTTTQIFHIQCYKAESYCRQGVPQTAMKLLRDKQNSVVKSEQETYLLQNSMNHYTYSQSISSYSISALNYLAAVITDGNLEEANHTMDNILSRANVNPTETTVPLPMLIPKIYLLLREGDNMTAAKLIKNQRNVFTINLGTSVKELN